MIFIGRCSFLASFRPIKCLRSGFHYGEIHERQLKILGKDILTIFNCKHVHLCIFVALIFGDYGGVYEPYWVSDM
jgi:hypothetical protein